MSQPPEPLIVYIRNPRYRGSLPFFYEPEQFPELKPLQDHWQEIRDEIRAFESRHGHIRGINTYSPPELSNDTGWSNIYLENFMWRFHRNRKNFPLICRLVDRIPNCTLAAISILAPHSAIHAHYGDTNGIVRGHLGLVVPAQAPVCALRVGTEERGWTEGGFTLFTEAHLHTAWNRSDQKRYILVVDLIPGFVRESKRSVCARVLGAQTFNYFEKKLPFLKHIPDAWLGPLHAVLRALWWLFLPIQRRVPFF